MRVSWTEWGVVVRCGWAALLLTGGWLASSCGGEHSEAPLAAAGSSVPVDELSGHAEEFCPAALPQASRESYGIGTHSRATTSPTLSKPEEAWICRYDPNDVAEKGSDGAWYEWVRRGTPRRLDERQLSLFSTVIGDLKPRSGNEVCTLELGSRYLVSYGHPDDVTGVLFDSYGCRDVRLTDDPLRTVPGEPTKAGSVKGVLAGPRDALTEFGVE